MVRSRHEEDCDAPICQRGDNQDSVLWYPGEPVCSLTPREHWQRIQSKINKLLIKGAYEHAECCYYSKEMLSSMQRVSVGTSGMNPQTKNHCRCEY